MTGTEGTEPPGVETFADVRFVGPATAAVLGDTDVSPADVADRRVSHAELVDAGVNPGVAARIRREHSLPWSFDGGGDDLDRRADQVRGLGDDERAWVAESAGDWQDREPGSDSTGERAGAEADGNGDARDAEAAWRERSKARPVTDVSGVGERRAEQLAEAGIVSVRSLAVADPEEVADALEFGVDRVRRWRERAADAQ